MSGEQNPLAELSLVGGRWCLDFANTVGWRGEENARDRLKEYADLVWWGLHAEALTPAEAEPLFAVARAKPEAAAEVFSRAIELREAVYRIFSAEAAGEPRAPADLAILNRELARAMSRARLTAGRGKCDWEWEETGEPDRVLWPVARSAAELLTSDELERVKECAGDDCGWLYVDTSKNRSRRWCDMKDCGNRAKVRRHYVRHKGGDNST